VVAVTEGGYNLHGLADGLRETIAALDSGPTSPGGGAAARSADAGAGPGDTARGTATLAAVLPVIAPHWTV